MTSTIKLFGKVSLAQSAIAPATPNPVSALNIEVAYFGYTFAPRLIKALSQLSESDFTLFRDSVLADLASIKGADKSYIRLFNKFPYSTPDQHEYFEKRVIGQMAHDYGIPLGGNTLTPLSCGHVIDSALFDIDDFGACPICQYSVPELSSPDVAVYDFKSVTPLSPIDVTDDGWRTEGSRLLARNGSLSKDEKEFLSGLVAQGVALDFPKTMFRETLPFAFKLFGADAVKDSISSATDIMRIAYFVSDEASDLSLKENVKFRLSTSMKNSLLKLLEDTSNLAEDMMRNRERWIRLGERLNPSSAKNKVRYPKTAAAFDRLRNDQKSIVTFNRQVEEQVRALAVDQTLIDLLVERPGEYARRLDFLLRTAEDASIVVEGLRKVAPKLPERLMLELRKYLGSRNDMNQRMFIPKGKINKMQVVADERKPLPVEATLESIMVLDTELMARYALKEALGKVFIDPSLKDVLLPFNRRGDSSSSTSEVSKGSRYPVEGDVLRMFVWWQNGDQYCVDVDLSMVYMDENFVETGHIGFTNLSNNASKHSGDIQDAPTEAGASEFIDIDIEKMVSKLKARYVAISVISYSGQPFNDFPCFAGFMERDSMTSGKVFEPASVRFRFDLTGSVTRTIPLVFDLKERKVIFADISGGSGRYGAVRSQGDKHKAMTEAVMSYPERKPTLFDVALLNALARGNLVDTKEEADVVFDLSDTQKLLDEVGLA